MRKGYQSMNKKNKKGKGKKIFISFVALSLFTTIAFGGSDAGIFLQNWYDKLFSNAASEIEKTYRSYLDTSLDMDDPESMQGEIDEMAGDVNKKTNSSIEDYAAIAKGDLTTKNTEINGYMESQFKELEDRAKADIDTKGNGQYEAIYGKFEADSSLARTEAERTLEADIQVSEEQAKIELAAQIERIKAELQANLEKNKNSSDVFLKNYIDEKILKIEDLIAGSRIELVAKQQQLITEFGLKLENDAKSELDGLINGIDN